MMQNTILETVGPYIASVLTGLIGFLSGKRMKAATAQKAELSGTARNLLGNKQTLNFKEVIEGESIYYLAQVDFTNEEILRFEIEIQQSNQFQTLQFQQKFYVDK